MPLPINPSAPTIPDAKLGQLLTHDEAAPFLQDATLLCSSEQDNDNEFFYLTAAGQIVRNTGENRDRFYVFDRNDEDIKELLMSVAADEALAKVWTPDEIAAWQADANFVAPR